MEEIQWKRMKKPPLNADVGWEAVVDGIRLVIEKHSVEPLPARGNRAPFTATLRARGERVVIPGAPWKTFRAAVQAAVQAAREAAAPPTLNWTTGRGPSVRLYAATDHRDDGAGYRIKDPDASDSVPVLTVTPRRQGSRLTGRAQLVASAATVSQLIALANALRQVSLEGRLLPPESREERG